jgi:phosphohistidine swiveling domain-containing protein
MPYKKYNWEVIGHDNNSPYLRNSLWTQSFFKYPEFLGVVRAVLGIASRNNQIEYLADMSTWMRVHEELKAMIVADFKKFEELIDKSVEWGEKMNAWTEKNIFEKGLSLLSGDELIVLLKNFIDLQEGEYAYGTALPVLDYQGFSFVEGNLNRILKENVSEEKFLDYYSVFTEPEQNSFAQDQEEDLLKLMNRYWENAEWREDIKNKKFDEVKSKYAQFYSDISAHAEKHGWVYYVYMGPAFSEKDFYGFIVDFVGKGVSPEQKLKELKEKREQIASLKKKYLRELNLDGLDAFILEIVGRVVWAKPRRKDYQTKSYYHAEKLCREIAKRLFISLEQVRSAPLDILEKALSGQTVDWSIANKIKNFHLCLPNDDGTVTTLVGDEAEDFSRKFIKRNEMEFDLTEVKELTGSTACVGKVSGRAKIVNVPEDMLKMQEGDILVSVATTPSIVPAMKKAAAIVTDEGGLTCHASIVSRELNIPCVVGLKVVTKFVKDGDLLEVDATKGLVRRI